jgi:hypothetical protein
MATQLYSLDRHSEALRYANHSLRFFGDNPAAHCCKAICYHQMREFETALVCIDRALGVGHDSRAFREMRAMIRAEMGMDE